MTRVPVFVALIPWILLLARPCFALQGLSDFAESAKKKSFSVRIAEATVEQKRVESKVAESKLLPIFTATGTYTHNQYGVTVQFPDGSGGNVSRTITAHNQLDARLALTMPLINVGSWDRVRAGHQSVDAAILRRGSVAIEAQKQAVRDYAQLVANEALIASASESLRVAEDNERRIKAHLDAGVGANEADAARASAEVLRNRQLVAEAVFQAAGARRAIATDTGLIAEPGAPSLSEDLTPEASLSVWTARASGVPSVVAADADARVAESQLTSARDGWLPTASLSATEAFTNSTGFGHSPNYFVAMSAVWQFDWGIRAQEQSAEASLEIARIQAAQARALANDELYLAHCRVHSQIEKARAALAQLDASKTSARITRERWLAGKATLFDTVQADRDVLAADVSRIAALADLALARAQLRLAAGLSPERGPR